MNEKYNTVLNLFMYKQITANEPTLVNNNINSSPVSINIHTVHI